MTRSTTCGSSALACRLPRGRGCAELEKEKPPRSPPPARTRSSVGATITIVPATTNGTDDSVQRSPAPPRRSPPSTRLGAVTGVAPGETQHRTVTGASTGASRRSPRRRRCCRAAGGPAPHVPFYEAWLSSAHADRTAQAFTHWNKEGEVPTTCARCHSSEGFVDYLGGDNSVPGVVDKPGADRVGRPLRHLPRPRRRAADRGHLPLGRQGRRAWAARRPA